MGYRGEDLDLRTPQTWSTTAADLAGEGPARGRSSHTAGQRNGPIWVDETVLAACNHAFDVALAHRAGEVTLEHLLHALTRIDDAAEALEARGIRVTALRRETATIIASEIPIGLPNGKGTPRRSEEMEEALRLAAMSAARHDAPANVDDLLRAMSEVRPDLPGLQQRLGARQTNSYYDAPPLISRTGFAYDSMEPSRDRPRSYQPAEPRISRGDPAASLSMAPAASRIDALEQMVRALSNDLANERKAITGVLQDLQREVAVQRDDMGRHSAAGTERLQSEMSDRLQGIERAMMSARSQGAVDLGPVLERLADLERAVAAPRPAAHLDLSAITSRLDMIEEVMLSQETAGLNEMLARIKAMEDGLKALETVVASERIRAAEAQAALVTEIRALSEAVVTPVTQRLDAAAARLDQQSADSAARIREIGDKLSTLDAAVGAASRTAGEVQTAHVHELKELHDAVMKLNTNQHTLAGSIDQWRRDSTSQMAATAEKLQLVGGAVDSITLSLGSLGSGVSGLTSSVAGIGTRLETVEKESAKPIAMLETVSGTLDKMHKVTVERYYRRNRIWYWLFGTDDWVAASWPSQAARIVEDLKIVRATPSAPGAKK